ncbi:hypothetical protein RclHR1_20740001 [Rhizophagus clarus]|uniref:Uncharacterized protein n=1 Tax=Rhizophagus clarus TaxID=94130 RepID=A0A2Z6R4E3_9GLOM|nr:hypothetical protein RclHR1_20740001 [Rhizophagus clarus]
MRSICVCKILRSEGNKILLGIGTLILIGQIGGIGTIVLRVASPGDVVLIFSEYLSRRLEISLGLSMFLYLRPLVMAPSGGFSIIYVRVIYDASTAINDFRLETCSETKVSVSDSI